MIGLLLCRFPAWNRDGTPLPRSNVHAFSRQTEQRQKNVNDLDWLIWFWEGVGAWDWLSPGDQVICHTRGRSGHFCCFVQLISWFSCRASFSYRILQVRKDLAGTIHHYLAMPPNSWFVLTLKWFQECKHSSAITHHIRGSDILQASFQGKLGAVRHFLKDPNAVKTTLEGRSLGSREVPWKLQMHAKQVDCFMIFFQIWLRMPFSRTLGFFRLSVCLVDLIWYHEFIFDVHSLSCNNVCPNFRPKHWASAWMNVWRATQILSLVIWMRCKSRFPSRAQTCGQTNNDFFIALASFRIGQNHLTMQLTGPSASATPAGAPRLDVAAPCSKQRPRQRGPAAAGGRRCGGGRGQ